MPLGFFCDALSIFKINSHVFTVTPNVMQMSLSGGIECVFEEELISYVQDTNIDCVPGMFQWSELLGVNSWSDVFGVGLGFR